MSEMIDRIAKVLCADAGEIGDTPTPYHPDVNFVWQYYRVPARKVLEAMREPTDIMFVSGNEKIIETLNDHTFALSGLTPSVKCWYAMIDAALK